MSSFNGEKTVPHKNYVQHTSEREENITRQKAL
jgi:hypothetical protein